jgi:hypothetical protein
MQKLVPCARDFLALIKTQVEKLTEDQTKELAEHLSYEVKCIREFVAELKKETVSSLNVMESRYVFSGNGNGVNLKPLNPLKLRNNINTKSLRFDIYQEFI